MKQLILLPGMDGSSALFAPFLRSMAQIAPHIQPTPIIYPANTPLTHAQQVAHALAQIQDNLEPIYILGESYSGPTATELAHRLGTRCHGLILCASFTQAPLISAPILKQLLRIAPLALLQKTPTPLHRPVLQWVMGKLPADLQNRFEQLIQTVTPAVWRMRLHNVLHTNTTPLFAALQCPILYLQAAQDRLIKPHVAQRLASHQPTMRRVMIAAPHFLLQNQPEIAAHVVKEWLRD
jgi:pimeloyl-[acyl-carrier protein] methyl ester esterase